MIRPRNASTSASARVALSLVALGLAACSFSFKSGSSASNEAGKPARTTQGSRTPTKPTRKPVAKADPATPTQPAEPTPTEPPEDAGPTRTPPAQDPPPVVDPSPIAVCRVQDPTLSGLCHRALDPIAADDIEAWSTHLDDAVVVTRPTFRRGMQRVEGSKAVRDVAARAGGLRALLHLRPTDRIVGTLARDCRECRRAAVSFEANTRSGTITVSLEMTQPPRIVSVEVDSNVRRPHIDPQRQPKPTPPSKPDPTDEPVIVPPAEPEAPAKPAPKLAPTNKKKPALLVAPKPAE